MKRLIAVLLALWMICPTGFGQQAITLEDIWRDYKFYAQGVPGFDFLKDGKSYTRQNGNAIEQYDFTTGDFIETIFDASQVNGIEGFDAYSFNADESKILLQTDREPIYRRSSKANYFIYDRASKSLTKLHDGSKQMFATLSPDDTKIAFVSDNNLFYKDLNSGKIVQVTKNGAYNQVINGAADWVYEEEFSLTKSFEWSPDSERLAFLRFDESAVKEFTMQVYKDGLYPENVTFKYPKVGENNAIVTAHIYNLSRDKTIRVETGRETDIYLPRIRWTEEGELCVFRMNRHQSVLDLLLTNPKNGRTKLMFQEREEQYIEESILDNITFLSDGKHFLTTSERDGYHHIYLFDMKGKLKKQLTKGKWDVTAFYGVDEKNETVFYQAAKDSPMRKHIYSVNLKGKKDKQLSQKEGTNSATFSSTFDYYVLNHSTINTPPSYAIYNRSGKSIRTLQENKRVAELQKEYGVSDVEFFDFKTDDNVTLNGWMMKPANFNPRKEYPVFMFLYGGPGSQQVTDSWKSFNYWWFQMLTQQGFIVACVDNRGTGGRGEDFKKITYLKLGHYETIDQIAAAKYLGSLDYTDEDNIGIFGWSYGGYMSSLCLLKGNDVFKAAIAVAPVTSWKWYDTVYTERYMRTLSENEDGYKENSPVYFADRLKGDYLLVHGTGDDNVHFQHSVEMANALINANKQFETYFYPNRNHGIYGGNTRLHLYTKMTNFLMETLMEE